MRWRALAPILLLGAALSACAPFAAVGSARAAASSGTRLGQSTHLGGRIITPLEIVEDSRCPSGAQCIQAGTVRLQARVQWGSRDSVSIVGLRSPADIGGAWLHLVRVCPDPQLSRPIAQAEYRLSLLIRNSPVLPPESIACAPR